MKINKTATGRYQVRWKVWRSGKTIARPQRTFRTRREAQTFVENLAAERRTDRSAATRPFNAYADAWLQTVEARGRKDRTLESYSSGLRYARTYFGTTPVGTITPLDAQAFLNYLRNPAECPALKQPRSVLGAWVVFPSTLRLAYRQGALPANPADAVDPPGRVSADRRQARYTFLRPAEVERLASVLDNRHPYGLLVRFAAYTGLRRGEVAGLDVRHITLAQTASGGWSGRVEVSQTRRKRGGVWVLDTPKSHKSRTVPLPGWLAEDLHAYLTGHPGGSNPDAPLFPNRVGGGYTHGRKRATTPDGTPTARAGYRLDWATPVEPEAFYRNVFKPAVVAAGLPPTLRFHDLRHTYASLVAADVQRPEVVAKLLGHADATVTLQVYTHLWPEHLDDAVAALLDRSRLPPRRSRPYPRQ